MNAPARSRRSRRQLRAVLLDAYGTLFHYEPDRMADLFHSIVDRLGVPVESGALLERWRAHEDAFRKRRIRRAENGEWDMPPDHQFTPYRQAWTEAFRLASDDLNLNGGFSEKAAELIVRDLITREMYRDVPPALEAMRARVPLAIVSNADDDFLHGTLRHNNLTFDLVVHSEGERVYKPHPRMFRAALQALGIDDPAHALYIGDSPREDILGARGAGIPAVWINRAGADWPDEQGDAADYEVADLLGAVDIVASKTHAAL